MPVTVLVFLKKADNITTEEFRRYWKDVHGPLFVSSGLADKYCHSYKQHHNMGLGGSAFPQLEFDGIAEFVFKSTEASMRMSMDEVYRRLIVPSELRFLKPGESRIMVSNVVEQYEALGQKL